MTDMNKKRADFYAWLRTYEDEVGAVDEASAWVGFLGGRASLAASAGSEPVATGSIAHLKLMMEASAWGGELQLSDALANIDDFVAAHPSPPEGAGAEQALLKVLAAVQRYLPPDGPNAKDTLSEIIAIVDPWPLGPLEKP